jgi:hypothetical protein
VALVFCWVGIGKEVVVLFVGDGEVLNFGVSM